MKIAVAALCAGVALRSVFAADVLTAREALMAVDIGPNPSAKYNEVVFEVQISSDGASQSMSFCAKLSSVIWFSDEEVNRSNNLPALFDVFKAKLGTRAIDHNIEQKFNRLHKLSAFARMMCQGTLHVIENNVQNETKNVSFTVRISKTVATKVQLTQLVSYTPELSLYLNDGFCENLPESEEVDLGVDPETPKFHDIAFSALGLPMDGQEQHMGPAANEPGVPPKQLDLLGDGTGETISSDANVSEGTNSQSTESGVTDANDSNGDSTQSDISAHNATVETKDSAGNAATEEPAAESNDRPEYVPQTPEKETAFMTRFEQVDSQDHPGDALEPVKVTFKAHVVDKERASHKDVVSNASILMNKNMIKGCQQEHLFKCIDAIREKVFDRFEDVGSKDFVRGKFISLLQALMLRKEVYARRLEPEGNAPHIEIFVPEYITLFNDFPQWDKLFGKIESKSKRISIDIGEATEQLLKPDDAQVVALGAGYPSEKYETLFIEGHPELRLDKPVEKKKNTKKTEESHVTEDVSATGEAVPSEGKSEGETEGVPSEAVPKVNAPSVDIKDDEVKVPEMDQIKVPVKEVKPESHHDMHVILSKYERALLQVPKEINGYQLSYKDIEDYPNLQEIWKVGLTTMKLMKPDEDLKTFLDRHTFTYDQLKELFNFAYGVIAVEQYESVKEFYEAAKIPKEAVETSLTKVKNLFKANTGTNITRLPPVLKKTAHTCPVKDMIISLSTGDLIDRLHVMLGSWMEVYQDDDAPEGNFQLAALCSAAAVFVQQWRYMQWAQGYKEEGDAWIMLMQSFSRMGQSQNEKPEVREKYQLFINSNVAKTCRTYMNEAGNVAYSPYKGISRNFNPLSLTGAIGNVLDQNMEATTEEIVESMKEYFTTANDKERIGNAMGVCMAMQMLNRMHNCLALESSNDYTIYKMGLFTKETAPILDAFTSANVLIGGKDVPQVSFIHMACDRRDSVVEETLDKLFKMLSTEGNSILIDTLDRRQYNHPEVDENGMMMDSPTGGNWAEEAYVPLDDVETLDKFEVEPGSQKSKDKRRESKASFLELHGNNVDDILSRHEDDQNNIMKMLMESEIGHNDIIGQKNVPNITTVYDKIMQRYNNHGIAHPNDLRTINFEFRMVPKFDDVDLKTMLIPLVFLKAESEYLKMLKAHEYPIVLLRKIQERMDKMKQHVPTEDLLNHVRSIGNLENKDAVTLSLNKHTVEINKKLNECKQLLNILKELPHDGFYFERADGRELPFHEIGHITARSIETQRDVPHTIVMQIIDPVHFVEDDHLFSGI
ncbi:rhoptry neck protein 4, putative [Babesia ovis]|uniref:Rhoptry neck protein 4, putative n=1 Tax=Babesia ovis TaxID=5869 RepID=A0A9W5TBL6_BABOV|nr:rhoptry neck protein 4, putative [Babesia ovis]